MNIKLMLAAVLLSMATSLNAQPTKAEWNTPQAGNPILPGYFADPTIRKFGDTYYIYATTDGTGNGYGPPQVWASKDFVNWRNVLMNWPTTEVVWAPDVVQQPDGMFRYYYCTPCEVRVGESKSPTGPWKNRLGRTDAVLVPDRFVHNAITLDPQLFRDDDGSEYLYFGTWGIYKGFGCGVAKLAEDGKSFTDKKLIENTEITDFFEAPFVFKKNGVYYFTYSSGSCHDDTYRVQYATSTAGPMGPYTYKGCILKTNDDGTVHGPGHHSILIDGEDYYIIYHRHNNPHSIHGFHRQLCIDKMEFDADGNIKPITPTHNGVLPASLAAKAEKNRFTNLAFGAKATASSTYSEWFKPEYATDDNNGTLWRAADVAVLKDAWLQVDLGKAMKFNTIFTQFEYATFFYQYKIEVSKDGRRWALFADRTANTTQGSPMIDTTPDRHKGIKARYIRLTITGTQKNGHFPAVWNIKVYNATKKADPVAALPQIEVDEQAVVNGYPWIHQKDLPRDVKQTGARCLLDIDASHYPLGLTVQDVPVVPKDGMAALRFTGLSTIKTDTADLSSLTYNAPYTITAWTLNPEASQIETVASLMPVGNDLATIELRNSTNPKEGIVAHNASFENTGAATALKQGQWQHWAVTFDGFNERVYCDGKQVSEKNIFLMLRPGGTVTIGADAGGGNPFTGYLHSLRMYNHPFTTEEVKADMAARKTLSKTELDKLSAAAAAENNSYTLKAVRLTPKDIEVSIVDNKGYTAKSGFGDYAFAIGNDKSCLNGATKSALPVCVMRTDKAPSGKVYAQMTDMLGQTMPAMSVDLSKIKADFNDLAAPKTKGSDSKHFVLESSSTDFNSDPKLNGPTETVDVEGDFVLVAQFDDMTGLAEKAVPAYNEAGIILTGETSDGQSQQLVQLGVFPHYNCGNMLTVLDSMSRRQFPNNKGYSFDRLLQIERRSDMLHARTCGIDGIWKEMPGSPFACPQSLKGKVKAGLYQTTYSENKAAATLSDLHIWLKKN